MSRGANRGQAIHTVTLCSHPNGRGPTTAEAQEHHTCRVYVRRVQDLVQHSLQIANPSHHVKISPRVTASPEIKNYGGDTRGGKISGQSLIAKIVTGSFSPAAGDSMTDNERRIQHRGSG